MMKSIKLWPLGLCIFLFGCNNTTVQLPGAISNNAVAFHAPTQMVYSFAGLGAGKTWQDVTATAYACDLQQKTCSTIPALPDGVGRLAATAQTVGDMIYVLGGYTVADDGSEVSMPEVWAYDVKSQTYSRKADMPVPVDDSVSVVFQDRYLYLVSGWHKDDNVVNVQIYDTKEDIWQPATDWPGVPVFGHAGGIVGDVMVVCDGVQIIAPKTSGARRTFEDINACWRGDIDQEHPTDISWRRLPQLPGKGNYRMAATGWPDANTIIFAGGSNNPYNYNGIGYDTVPSVPSRHVWGYDIKADKYVVFDDKEIATMDHRALVHLHGVKFLTIGGMGAGQTVLKDLNFFEVKP